MANKVVQLNSFCGGSSKLLDTAFVGHESSVNMFPETIEASEAFSRKILKALDGIDRKQMLISSDNDERIIGICKVSCMPDDISTNDGTGIFIVHTGGCAVYYKDPAGDEHVKKCNMTSAASAGWSTYFNNGLTKVHFAETSGSKYCIVFSFNTKLFMASFENSFININKLTPPTSFVTDEPVKVGGLCTLNYRVVIAEEGTDYIYWSELNQPNGVASEHPFEQQLTCYAYTKNDGTTVSFSDQQYYPPAAGTYQSGTLQTKTDYYGALNNVKADFRGDKIVSIVGLDDRFVVLGSTSIQTYKWQNNENCPFVTENHNSSVGCVFKNSAINVDGSAIFVGGGQRGGRGVYSAGPAGVEKISTPSIDQKITNFSRKYGNFESTGNIQDFVKAFTYGKDGHVFYVLSFFYCHKTGSTENGYWVEDSDGKFYLGGVDDEQLEEEFTIVYDFTEKVWHERCSLDQSGERRAWIPTDAVVYDNDVVLTSLRVKSPYLMSLDHSKFTDLTGYPILRERTTGVKFDNFQDLIIRSLEIMTSNGDVKDYSEDPKVVLQVSLDGGYTWGEEMLNRMGKVGNFDFRTIWRNLGKGTKIAFRLRMTDPAPFDLSTAMLEYSVCGNRV